MSDAQNLAIHKQWYVLQVYAGMERTAQKALQEAIQVSAIQEHFGDILVPSEEVMDIKNGKKVIKERRFFPGYILIQMHMSDEAWYLVRQAKKISGFVGGTKNKPAPIPQVEVDRILDYMQEGAQKPRPRVEFIPGEMIRVTDGPFNDFIGHVEEVNYDKSRLRISISILGRSTPVELDFIQVEKE